MHNSDLLRKAFLLSLIGYTPTHEKVVCHCDWMYWLFSHVKGRHIEFFKYALWYKIHVTFNIHIHLHVHGHVYMCIHTYIHRYLPTYLPTYLEKK